MSLLLLNCIYVNMSLILTKKAVYWCSTLMVHNMVLRVGNLICPEVGMHFVCFSAELSSCRGKMIVCNSFSHPNSKLKWLKPANNEKG